MGLADPCGDRDDAWDELEDDPCILFWLLPKLLLLPRWRPFDVEDEYCDERWLLPGSRSKSKKADTLKLE